MANKTTTLHPLRSKADNLYPNVIEDNIPDTIQRKLTAGENVTISEDNVISATGGVTDAYTKAETDELLALKTDNTLFETFKKNVTEYEEKTDTDIETLYTKISAKQDNLTTAQLNACNSGITSSKVTAYDSYATQISAKQDKLVSGTNIKTVNGISLLGSGNIEISGDGDTNHSMHTFDLQVSQDNTIYYKLSLIVTGTMLSVIKNTLMSMTSTTTWDACKSTLQTMWSSLEASTRVSQFLSPLAKLTPVCPIYFVTKQEGGFYPCLIMPLESVYVMLCSYPESYTSSQATGIKWLNVTTTLASYNTLAIVIDD